MNMLLSTVESLRHLGGTVVSWFALLLNSKKVLSLIPGLGHLYVEFACSPVSACL